jgi:hypothetical protein
VRYQVDQFYVREHVCDSEMNAPAQEKEKKEMILIVSSKRLQLQSIVCYGFELP